ncbi:MAG: cytochrome b/b6 domain-containing protein [Hyphomicrobiaceae bacterium]|nr:cytochrome b/b6 domain-containing protein [Hyphomicrobiaceae bacterium]
MTDVTERLRAGGATPPARATPAGAAETVRVWDPFVRVFHWSLVILFAVAWATGDELQLLHEWAGYAIAVLLAARVVWGIIGTTHARFGDFIYRPSAVASHLADSLRFRARRYLGHNPAGGAMVVALLLTLALTAATGILMSGEAYRDAHWLEDIHEMAANLMLLLIGLHVAGVILASFEHRENLVKAMLTGRKRRQPDDSGIPSTHDP